MSTTYLDQNLDPVEDQSKATFARVEGDDGVIDLVLVGSVAKGGPGSGFFGHEGRPGEGIGGSKPRGAAGGAEPKPGMTREQFTGLVNETHEEVMRNIQNRKDIQAKIPELAKRVGFPADKIDVYAHSPEHLIGGTVGKASAAYHNDTGRMSIYADEFKTPERKAELESIMAHEVEHMRFIKAFPGVVTGDAPQDFIDFVNAHGGLGAYGNSGMNVSPYARQHWVAAHDHQEPLGIAFTETTSELERLRVEAGEQTREEWLQDKWAPEFEPWHALAQEIDKRYRAKS